MLSCKRISKRFGNDTLALEEVSLAVKKGEVFGLLGLNGAGKTTLLRCIVKLIEPTSGEIFFKTNPLLNQDIQRNFGFLPENFSPPPNLKAKELLEILTWGLNLNPARVNLCLEQVGLIEQRHKSISQYSRGMIQRLGLALALLKEPEIIILDEPTLGLDPLGQAQILSILVSLNKKGKTVFFSSHTLSQIEKVCHRIAIINQGRLRFVGDIAEITAKHRSHSLEEAFLKEVS